VLSLLSCVDYLLTSVSSFRKLSKINTCFSYWLRGVASQEAEIRRIMVRSQLRQIVWETLSQKTPSQKKASGVVPDVGPEFKPWYCKKGIVCSTTFIAFTSFLLQLSGLPKFS
jgi:hypothetical protein